MTPTGAWCPPSNGSRETPTGPPVNELRQNQRGPDQWVAEPLAPTGPPVNGLRLNQRGPDQWVAEPIVRGVLERGWSIEKTRYTSVRVVPEQWLAETTERHGNHFEKYGQHRDSVDHSACPCGRPGNPPIYSLACWMRAHVRTDECNRHTKPCKTMGQRQPPPLVLSLSAGTPASREREPDTRNKTRTKSQTHKPTHIAHMQARTRTHTHTHTHT